MILFLMYTYAATSLVRKRTANAIDNSEDSKLSADDIREAVRQMQKSQKLSTVSGAVGGGGLPLFERRVPPPVLEEDSDTDVI